MAASLLDDAPELELGEALEPELLGCAALELELELGWEALDPELLGCALEPELLGWALEPELELESLLLGDALLLGAGLEPPEAEPDFEVSELDELDELLAGSLEPELPPLTPTDVLEEPGVDEALPEGGVALLDEEELGAVELGAVDDAPPEAEPDVEPGALDGDDGVVALLELDEPGAEEDLLALSRSHAARPKARATATARVDSFMGPPWVKGNVR